MQTIPNSELYLIANVPLTPNYEYTLDFDSLSQQTAYFNSKISSILTINEDYSYISHSQKINICVNIEELHNINYLKFKNADKWIYAFILNKEYIHDKCTAITFKVDVLQTFMFDYEIDESFVEREHQDRYITPTQRYYNLETENLDIGKNYKILSRKIIKTTIQNYIREQCLGELYFVLLQFNSNKVTGTITAKTLQTSLFSMIVPVFVPYSSTNFDVYIDSDKLLSLTELQDYFGDSPELLKMAILPYISDGCILLKDIDQTNHKINLTATCDIGTVTINEHTTKGLRPAYIDTTLDNVSGSALLPSIKTFNATINDLKNIEYESKLYTSPYYYYKLIYQDNEQPIYNEFLTNDKNINLKGKLSSNGATKLKIYADEYNNDTGNYLQPNEYLNLVVDNELPLRTDAYAQYLRNNSVSARAGVLTNITSNIAGGIIGYASTGSVLPLISAGISSAQNIASDLIKKQDLKQTPDTIKNIGFDVTYWFADNQIFPRFECYGIQEQFKQKIFNYFYRYGYQCNDFKKPNVRSRYYFNYIKTIGANIKTNIDADYRTEIEDIFNKGVTIWHYRTNDTFKGVNNYDYENVEMNLMQEDIVNE